MANDSETRARALLTVAAAAITYNGFERAEASIWASQIAVLEFLNSTHEGATREQLKTMFYDQAAARFPAWFESYSFDRYLDFLASFGFINAGLVTVTITDAGREYLIWRVQQRKVPKVVA